MRLGASLPFEEVAEHLEVLFGVQVSPPTVLRQTEQAGRVASIGEVARLAEMSVPADWLEGMVHRLKHEGARGVLPLLSALFEQAGQPEAMQEPLSYLRKREAHMDYPTFQAQGWPIGSGPLENLHVPRDREGNFYTEVFDRYSRYEPEVAEGRFMATFGESARLLKTQTKR